MKGHCTTCGMVTDHPGEYHPYAFCVLKRAGLDPWREVRRIAGQLAGAGLNMDRLPEHPPRVVEVIR